MLKSSGPQAPKARSAQQLGETGHHEPLRHSRVRARLLRRGARGAFRAGSLRSMSSPAWSAMPPMPGTSQRPCSGTGALPRARFFSRSGGRLARRADRPAGPAPQVEQGDVPIGVLGYRRAQCRWLRRRELTRLADFLA